MKIFILQHVNTPLLKVKRCRFIRFKACCCELFSSINGEYQLYFHPRTIINISLTAIYKADITLHSPSNSAC